MAYQYSAARDEFTVTTAMNGQRSPGITQLAGGGYVVVWQDNTQTNADTSDSAILMQRLTAEGLPVGPEALVNSTTADGVVAEPLPDA